MTVHVNSSVSVSSVSFSSSSKDPLTFGDDRSGVDSQSAPAAALPNLDENSEGSLEDFWLDFRRRQQPISNPTVDSSAAISSAPHLEQKLLRCCGGADGGSGADAGAGAGGVHGFIALHSESMV